MEYDIHTVMDDRVALDPQAIAGNGTIVGNIIDTKGYGSLEFLIWSKTITDGTHTVKLEEGDDAALADAADITDVLGTLPALVAADDNAVKRVGEIGKKRYKRLSIVSTDVTTGVDAIGALAVLQHPYSAPVAQ